MKTNNKWTGISRLKKEYYQTWADYHLRWLELYEKAGIPIWAISTENKPTNGVFLNIFIKFLSLGWTPSQQVNRKSCRNSNKNFVTRLIENF